MKKILVLFIIICALMITSCTSDNSELVTENEEQSKVISELEATILELEESNSSLEVKLANEVSNSSENDDLENVINELENMNSELHSEVENLTSLVNEKDEEIVRFEEGVEIYERFNETNDYYDLNDLLFWLVVRFDHSWVKYINNDDPEIFSYMVEDSDIYNIATNFKANHEAMEEKIFAIGMYEVIVDGDFADIYVFERLEQYTEDGTNYKEYDWIYSAEKIDGIWYLTEMNHAD